MVTCLRTLVFDFVLRGEGGADDEGGRPAKEGSPLDGDGHQLLGHRAEFGECVVWRVFFYICKGGGGGSVGLRQRENSVKGENSVQGENSVKERIP